MNAVGQLRIEFVASTDQMKGQIADLQKKLDAVGKNGSAGFKAVGGSARNAAAALRELQGGFDSRSLARFLMQSQQLSKVFSNPAFLSGVGIVAVGFLFNKLSKSVEEFQNKVESAAQKMRSGFDQISTGQQESIDKLDVANDKLDIQIAKIEHKPVNAMKLAIDETKEAADRLAISIQADVDKINELLDKNAV